MLPWLDREELYRHCFNLARNAKRNQVDVELFLKHCGLAWQEALACREEEVGEMVAWGLTQTEPTIIITDDIPLMPPSTLATATGIDSPPLPGVFTDTDEFATDARGIAMTAYRPVLTRKLARLIQMTWGGSRHDACRTIRLWDANCQRGELLCQVLTDAIFGPPPAYDEAEARAWLQNNMQTLIELPPAMPPKAKPPKAKPPASNNPTSGQLGLL